MWLPTFLDFLFYTSRLLLCYQNRLFLSTFVPFHPIPSHPTSRAIGLETSFMQGDVARQHPSPGTDHPTGIMTAAVSGKMFHTRAQSSDSGDQGNCP